jgi:hypothetical protein
MKPIAVVAFLLLSAGSVRAQTADEVIEKHLAAMGGRETLSSIRTRVVNGSITLTTAVGPLSGTVQVFSKVPNRNRTLVKIDASSVGAGQIVNDQRFDGLSGYVIDTLNGDREVTGTQLEAMRNGAFPSPWLDYRSRGLTIAIVGKESLAGRDAYVLETTPTTGPRGRTWIDAETFLPLKTAATVDVPQLGQIEQVTEFADYRTLDGMKIPFSVKTSNPVQTSTTIVVEVKHNVDVDDAMFMKP